ncbi:MAG: 3-dehydroquinate synthase [Eubacterium sp.]|nr:3-dehydroquinate synthase [Eubacterium sp.]MBR2560184.1 3-dehydroquinate synthase [Bacillota bacterium]
MKKFTISTEKPYDVIIGEGLLADTGRYLRALFTPRKVCVITDSTVNALFGKTVSDSLRDSGFQVSTVKFPAGEHSKTLTTYGNILEAMAEDAITRTDLVLALGGGVVGDMAGFAAGTYLRGVDYVQVPTTVIAATDAAIGGKTGIDILGGKNLAGLFWQPRLVLCDYSTFDTLPVQRFNDGVAEVVKNAVVSDANLISHIRDKRYEYVLERCISIKRSLVEADERDTGLRQLLNFGHTIGHGIEKLSAYKESHGQAVAKGMVAEARGAYLAGYTGNDISGELAGILESFGLDTSLGYDPEEIFRLARMDKKIRNGKINMIIPEAIGRCSLRKLTLDELRTFIWLGLTGSRPS